MKTSEFYGGVPSDDAEAELSPALAKVLALPHPVVVRVLKPVSVDGSYESQVCLGVLVSHLSAYGLDSALHLTGNFRYALLLPVPASLLTVFLTGTSHPKPK